MDALNVYTNRLLCCDCVEGMRRLPHGCIPLTVTSPPYDRMRHYGGHCFNFREVAAELYRITMPGGVLVWVVQDQIVDGSATATSAEQRLQFRDLGFWLHEHLVRVNPGKRSTSRIRYGLPPENIYVFSKGGPPRTVNLIRDRRNRHAGIARYDMVRCEPDGRRRRTGGGMTPVWGVRSTVWSYAIGRHVAREAFVRRAHPALMPEAMAEDLILSWSRPGDLVFDPMAGAATTCKMALLNDRVYLGMEVHEPYYELGLHRLQLARQEHRRRLDVALGLHRQ